MYYIKKTKKVINKIKKLEEKKYQKYNLKLNIETPTVIQYYINNIKDGSFTFYKNDKHMMKYLYTLPQKWDGHTNGYGDICIFAKNYHLSSFLNMSINDITKQQSFQEWKISYITYHEIRHSLQHIAGILSEYELFCCEALSNYDGLRGAEDKNFHDSLYCEIDANLYGATQSKELFHGDKYAEEYFDNKIGRYGLQKYTYDFDTEFDKHQNRLEFEHAKHDKYQSPSFPARTLWDKNWNLKKPIDIITNPEFNKASKQLIGFDALCARIISSPTYLSKLNKNELSNDELDFINRAMMFNLYLIEKEKEQIEEYHNQKQITDEQYKNAIDLLNNRLAQKEEYRNKYIKESSEESIEEFSAPNIEEKIKEKDINIEKLIGEMLKPEPPKKVAMVTKIKERLKSVIERIKTTKIKSAMLALGLLAEVATLDSGPISIAVGAGAIIGGSILASEIYKHNISRK